MTIRGQQPAVALTCLVAALSYAGVVTMHALAVYVLPAVAGSLLFALLLVARRLSGMALVVGTVLVLGWSELVNIWSGTGEGAAARSTFFAAGWSLVAVVAAYSRWPALFLEGVAGIVAGAVILGAGGEVRIVAVATALCAALTLGWLERSRRNWTMPPRRSAALIVLSLLAAAAAAGVVLWQAQKDPREPANVARGPGIHRIKPDWTDPLATASNALSERSHQSTSHKNASSSPPPPSHPQADRNNPPPRSKNPPPTTHHQPSPHVHRHSSTPQTAHTTQPHQSSAPKHTAQSKIWLFVLAAVLALIVLIAARLVTTRLAWRRVRRRFAAGTLPEQITGAWAWTRMRLEACRLPLADAVSPDLLAAGWAGDGFPAQVSVPLQALATATTTAAFASGQSLGTADAAAAWSAAGDAEASARELLTRRGRARLAFRGPAARALPRDHATPRGRKATRAVIIVAAGLAVTAAILVGFGVFRTGKEATPSASIPKQRSTTEAPISTPTVTAPRTTPHHAAAPRVKAPSQMLAPGDTGSQVRLLQQALAALGFSAGTPDGSYGPATQAAVERFQAARGLPQVGVVGPETLAALQHALSRRSRP